MPRSSCWKRFLRHVPGLDHLRRRTTRLRRRLQRRSLLVAIGAAVLLFAAAYANSWRSSFHFDDSHVVETNPAIRSLSNIPRFFRDARTFSSLPTNQTYRPIVTLTLAIDHAMAEATTGNGLDPRAYHFTQLLLLALVAALVGGVAGQLYAAASRDDPELATWAPWAAVAAATLFAVHVGNTEVGNYVSARSESLSAAGLLGGLFLYVRGGVWRRTHLYLLPMALGALSKTPAVLLAPLVLLWSVFDEDDVDLAALRTAFVRAIPAFVAAGALYLFVEGMNPPEQSYGGGSRLQNLWTQAWVAVRYAGVFFVPSGLSADSDWTALPSPWDARVLAGLALIAFSGWAAWRADASARHEADRVRHRVVLDRARAERRGSAGRGHERPSTVSLLRGSDDRRRLGRRPARASHGRRRAGATRGTRTRVARAGTSRRGDARAQPRVDQ